MGKDIEFSLVLVCMMCFEVDVDYGKVVCELGWQLCLVEELIWEVVWFWVVMCIVGKDFVVL